MHATVYASHVLRLQSDTAHQDANAFAVTHVPGRLEQIWSMDDQHAEKAHANYSA